MKTNRVLPHCFVQVSVTFDPFVYLSLPVDKKTKTVAEALAAFCEEERLEVGQRGRAEAPY